MQVYIMRHGEAESFFGQGHFDDSQRALTAQGNIEVNMMAKWLEKMQIKPTQVFVSPYIRAQQTCALVTTMMQTTITTLDFITPAGDVKQVHDFIDGWCSEQCSKQNTKQAQQSIYQAVNIEDVEQSLLIISHMPLVSYLVAQLTQSANAPIFATAAIAHIDYDIDKMHGTLQRLMSPIALC
ncbi:phosphohistidine phosphatase SixA [Colwellia ponticola]|uniref:Phosphohistidine phosphatase SixA n=1 Tax=Colwellia ponticola TaxID=2304625 RepID=A0A8H2JKJ0_9GAMM|nr:phosphohistidine phosphatase SixA [Colwellia ponticola]TMM44799.1 phosphohistidine phosphatase SixA [Colwellia ponticola]